jgi:hypothetical protein
MPGWTEDGLLNSWRALAERVEGEEWRFVRLAEIGGVEIEAARHFPGSREAVLFAVPATGNIELGALPKGRGFEVSVFHDAKAFPNRFVVALTRESAGSTDIFTVVAVDVLRLVEELHSDPTINVLHCLLARVRDWQMFMERSNRLLSADRQVGLMGELLVLTVLVRSELGPSALRVWKGPLRGIIDFHVGTTGIEIKSTAGSGTFVAKISSIEQLDNDCKTMFLCGLRFKEHEDGLSLPDVVANLRAQLVKYGVLRAFDAMLMTAGYLDEHSDQYSRRFTLSDVKVFEITPSFPHLTRAMMPAAVRAVSYGLDLDAITQGVANLAHLFTFLQLTYHES